MLKININIQPSKQFIALVFVTLVGCFGVIMYIPIFYGVKGLLGLFVLFYGKRILEEYGFLRHPNSIVELRRDEAEGYQLVTRNKEVLLVELLGESTITTWMSVLCFKEKDKKTKLSCLVFKDSVLPGEYRALTVLLRSLN